MKNKIIKWLCYLLAVLIFISGLLIFAFPLVNRAIINSNADNELEIFRSVRKVPDEDAEKSEDTENLYENVDLAKLYEDMRLYNSVIYKEGQSGLCDAWSYEQAGFDLSSYGLYNEVVAEIIIPKMNCDLPLYLGATNANMAKGAAQLGQTSTPIGGKNTNCVIAAHRGAAGGDFFKEIQLLELGDKVYIDNLWETMAYKVVKIEIINPDEIDKVLIQEGKDMITLTTCHPYPYNSQRYIVYCERTKLDIAETTITEETTQQTSQPIDTDNSSQWLIEFEKATYYIVPACLVLLVIGLTVKGKIKKKTK